MGVEGVRFCPPPTVGGTFDVGVRVKVGVGVSDGGRVPTNVPAGTLTGIVGTIIPPPLANVASSPPVSDVKIVETGVCVIVAGSMTVGNGVRVVVAVGVCVRVRVMVAVCVRVAVPVRVSVGVRVRVAVFVSVVVALADGISSAPAAPPSIAESRVVSAVGRISTVAVANISVAVGGSSVAVGSSVGAFMGVNDGASVSVAVGVSDGKTIKVGMTILS